MNTTLPRQTMPTHTDVLSLITTNREDTLWPFEIIDPLEEDQMEPQLYPNQKSAGRYSRKRTFFKHILKRLDNPYQNLFSRFRTYLKIKISISLPPNVFNTILLT